MAHNHGHQSERNPFIVWDNKAFHFESDAFILISAEKAFQVVFGVQGVKLVI